MGTFKPALKPEVSQGMLGVINERVAHMCALTVDNTYYLTCDELLTLIAPREHHDVLKSAAEYSAFNAGNSYADVFIPETVDGASLPYGVRFAWHDFEGQRAPLPPRRPLWQVGDWRQSVPATTVMEWLRKRLELGRKWGLVAHVLRELDARCVNGAQLRYMFPAALLLCQSTSSDASLDAWSTKHSSFVKQRSTPAIPNELKEAIREASGIVAGAALVGHDPVPPRSLPVTLTLPRGILPSFEWHGRTIERI